jgi:hypothetical protein
LEVRYHFRQSFAVPAQEAFNWCTGFDAQDHALMGEEGVERHITCLTESTIILEDVFCSDADKVEKEKLVQLYPDQLFWVSTHLTGPNKFSQFLYRISPQSKASSVLDFTGLHLDYNEKEDAQSLANRLRQEDANAWKLLAKAMAIEIEK